jgi:hypothetical protein
LKFPYFLDSRLTDGGEVVSLTRMSSFISQEGPWYSFLLEAESTPRAIVRLEGLGQLKNDFIRNRTCSLLACSIVSPTTTLPRTPVFYAVRILSKENRRLVLLVIFTAYLRSANISRYAARPVGR